MREVKLTLNDKGMLLIGLVILTLTFALGFMTCNVGGQKVTYFTEDEINRIVEMQKMAGAEESSIYVYKDKKGTLFIGLDDDVKKTSRKGGW